MCKPKELREELQKIIDRYKTDLSQQVASIEELRLTCPHNITVFKEFAFQDRERLFICYMYALNVHKSPSILEILGNQQNDQIKVDKKFVEHLIEKGVLKEVSDGQKRDGDVVIYFGDGHPQHAGKIHKDYVISKWGGGHLWKHKLLEVPESYGNEVKYFADPDPLTIESMFSEYCQSILNGTR